MRYEWNRGLEAWQYGAGLDYKLSPSEAHETAKRSDPSKETFSTNSLK